MEVTVKTLDSKVHSFNDLSEDISVKQFKEKIAPTVEVAASSQRLIFQGKVLKDERPLKEFGVAGKVIHLVERAPPPSVQNPGRSTGGESSPRQQSEQSEQQQQQRQDQMPHLHHHHHHHHHRRAEGMAGLFESLQLPSGMVNVTQSIMQGLMGSFGGSSSSSQQQPQANVSSSRSADGHSLNVQIDMSRQRGEQGSDRPVSARFVEARRTLDRAMREYQQMEPGNSEVVISQGEKCEEYFESAAGREPVSPRSQNQDFYALSRIMYDVLKLNKGMDPFLRQLSMCLRFPDKLEGPGSPHADSLALNAKNYFHHVGQCFRYLGDCCLLPSAEAPGMTPGRILAGSGFGVGPPLDHPFQRMQVEMERQTLAEMAASESAPASSAGEEPSRTDDSESFVRLDFQGSNEMNESGRESRTEERSRADSETATGNPSIEVRLNVVQHIPVGLARLLQMGLPSELQQQQQQAASHGERELSHPGGGSAPSEGSGAGSEDSAASGGEANFAHLLRGMSEQMLQAVISSMAGNDAAQSQMTLSQLFANVSEGMDLENEPDSAVSHLLDCIMQTMTIVESVQVLQGEVAPLTRLQPTITAYIEKEFLDGSPLTDMSSELAYENMVKSVREYTSEILIGATPRPGIALQQSLMNLLKKPMHQVITIIAAHHDEPNGFGLAVKKWFRKTMGHLVQLLAYCLEGGMASVENLLRRHTLGRIGMPNSGFPPGFQDIFYNVCLQQFITAYVADHPCSEDELLVWVSREEPRAEKMETESEETQNDGESASPLPPAPSASSAQRKVRTPDWIRALPDEIPDVTEREKWHVVLPNEWIPVVARDVKTQERMAAQRPLSDAYLNCMPAKRKKTAEVKTVSAGKAACDVLCSAIQSADVSQASSTPIDEISNAAAGTSQLAVVYSRELEHQLRDRVCNDPDFDPNVFPSAAAAYLASDK
eukprot:m.13102 g.13102  ORF g.13102 m.13102 type:complete len:941 (+) comp24476_c0_seq1:100-2922(+)